MSNDAEVVNTDETPFASIAQEFAELVFNAASQVPIGTRNYEVAQEALTAAEAANQGNFHLLEELIRERRAGLASIFEAAGGHFSYDLYQDGKPIT